MVEEHPVTAICQSFRFDLLEKHGCTTELASRLTYAYDKVDTMVNNRSGTGGGRVPSTNRPR